MHLQSFKIDTLKLFETVLTDIASSFPCRAPRQVKSVAIVGEVRGMTAGVSGITPLPLLVRGRLYPIIILSVGLLPLDGNISGS
jgi:hypothetical protein